jgi:hypothetical protein
VEIAFAMDELVQRLAEGDHPVVMRRTEFVEDLKQSIDRGYVLFTFTDTQGGTELGVRLDQTHTDLSRVDFEQGTGTAHLAGDLTLNYVKVRCMADVDIATLKGKGHLDILEDEVQL